MRRVLILILLAFISSCNRDSKTSDHYVQALRRTREFKEYADSVLRNSPTIHQWEYNLANLSDSINKSIIPYLDSVLPLFKKDEKMKVKLIQDYLELFTKSSRTARENDSLIMLEKQVDLILKEANK